MQINSNIQESKKLFAQIKASFVAQETTFAAWCRQNKLNPSNTRQAVYGSWNGPKAQKIRKQVLKAANLEAA